MGSAFSEVSADRGWAVRHGTVSGTSSARRSSIPAAGLTQYCVQQCVLRELRWQEFGLDRFDAHRSALVSAP
jgi:hypothetical protein